MDKYPFLCVDRLRDHSGFSQDSVTFPIAGALRPPTILFVITTLTFGGAETQVVRLASELRSRGWHVAVICMVDPVAYVDQLRAAGIPVHSLRMRRGLPDIRAVARLRKLVREILPDIVHSHMYHANILSRITRLFCRMPALVCTAHNLKETSEKGGPTWHKELTYRATDRLASKTTTICRAGFQRYLRVGAVPISRFRMIPNAVDTTVFCPSEERKKRSRRALALGDDFVWLAVGRLVRQKDYPTLLRAVAQLGSWKFKLLIVGSGPLEEELEEACQHYGLRRQVIFCGARQDIRDLYAASDGFVMSSSFEGMSVALLEAAAMGLPAVVTDVGGNSDVVLDGKTGYLVPPQNPPALADAMRRLMALAPDQRHNLSCAARHHAERHYGFPVVMREWLKLYTEYLPGSSLMNSSSEGAI
jgi:glycosyltransferase involved in cell wall biosynthesis